MSNFEITVTIKTPELAAAIEKLAAAIGGSAPTQTIPAVHTAPKQTAPTAPAPTQAYQSVPTSPAVNSAPAQIYRPAPTAPAANPTHAGPPAPQIALTRPNVTPTAPTAQPATMPNAPTATPVSAPTAQAPAYVVDDLARAAAQLMDAGKQQQLLSLLAQFGVQSLGQLQKEQFGAFATALRQMGARI